MNSLDNFHSVQILRPDIRTETGPMCLVRYTLARKTLLVPSSEIRRYDDGDAYTNGDTLRRAEEEFSVRSLMVVFANAEIILRDADRAEDCARRAEAAVETIRAAVNEAASSRTRPPASKKREKGTDAGPPLQVVVIRKTARACMFQLTLKFASGLTQDHHVWAPHGAMHDENHVKSWFLLKKIGELDVKAAYPYSWAGVNFTIDCPSADSAPTINRHEAP